MTDKNKLELGKALHQMCNYAAFFSFYCKCWENYSNHKQVNYVLKQAGSNMNSMIDKVANAIGQPELKDFVREQLNDEDRLADLMAILELCSRMNKESIANIRTSLERQLIPILEQEKL